MRWFLLAIALLALPACDDDSTTGPTPDPVADWKEVAVPAELGLGSVVGLAAGADRVVALVHSETGEWVIEETPTGWTTVLGEPLPFLPIESAAARTIRFINGSADLVVSDKGRIYVVGATVAPGGPYGDSARTPAIFSESDTGWVRTPGPEDAGFLLAAEWHEGVGIEAVGIGNTTATLLTVRGTPENGLEWSSTASPYPGFDEYIAEMALVGGTVYAGGTLYSDEPPSFRGLFLHGSGGALVPLDSPCGDCESLSIAAVEAHNGRVYWGGLLREDVPFGTLAKAFGWLTEYDPSGRTWTEIELPAEIERVHDILIVDSSPFGSGETLYLTVKTEGGSGIYRSTRRGGFEADVLPEGSFVNSLVEASDQRVIGGGSTARFPEGGDPVLVERK